MKQKRFIAPIAFGIVVVVTVVVVLPILRKRAGQSDWQERRAVMLKEGGQIMSLRRAAITSIERKLTDLKELVQDDDWFPLEVRSSVHADEVKHVLWRHDLREEERPKIAGPSSSLNRFFELLDWRDEPDEMVGAMLQYDRDFADEVARRADFLGSRYVAVAQLTDWTEPDITKFTDPGKGDDKVLYDDEGKPFKKLAEYSPGRTVFAVAVIDTQTMEVVALARGEATSSRTVTGRLDLNEDLWNNTHRALDQALKDLAERAKSAKPSGGS